MNIALIGLRGSGKTTLGRALAKQLDLEFVDTDLSLTTWAERTVAEIIGDGGWGWFRDLEAQTLEIVLENENQVIGTGGGIILRPQNRNLLREKCSVFYLHNEPQCLAERLAKDLQEDMRPTLTAASTILDEMEILYKTRHKIYKNTAHFIVPSECNFEESLKFIAEKSEYK